MPDVSRLSEEQQKSLADSFVKLISGYSEDLQDDSAMDLFDITFVMLKPDAVKRGLVGEVITRFEKKGFDILSMQMRTLSKEITEELYVEHKHKAFFADLVSFTTSGPVVIMAIWGKNAVPTVRKMVGVYSGVTAEPGTIRGDFSLTESNRNLIHASADYDDAVRELDIFFPFSLYVEKHMMFYWRYSFKDLYHKDPTPEQCEAYKKRF